MKKIVTTLALLTISSYTFAADSGPGCGWGTMVFKGKSGTFNHVLAATTNGTSGNQTFGMSSGTAGCDASQPITLASMYMNSNIDNISFDMSKGAGESLNALAELMGVASIHKAEFNRMAKAHFTEIFISSKTTSAEAIDNLLVVMKKNAVLKQYTA